MQRKIYTVEELMLDDSFLSYCLDKKSPERAFWEKNIALNSDQKSIFSEARYTITLLHAPLDDHEVNRQVEKIKNQIKNQERAGFVKETFGKAVSTRTAPTSYTKNPQRHLHKSYTVYGAVVLIAILVGVQLLKTPPAKITVANQPAVEISYQSGTGERKSIELPDGSVAVMNSNSSIKIAADYNHNERAVRLTGEAFFHVAKNPGKPFIVHSGAFSVTALGTSFYVHARDEETDYKVDLVEGKVRLASGDDKTKVAETTLMPGEEGAWQSSRMYFQKTSCDSAVIKKWVAGRLSFKNMEVEKVLDLLREWYSVNIIVKHKNWNKLTLTGDYDNKPLDHVLKIICFSLSAGYSYSGNQVIIE